MSQQSELRTYFGKCRFWWNAFRALNPPERDRLMNLLYGVNPAYQGESTEIRDRMLQTLPGLEDLHIIKSVLSRQVQADKEDKPLEQFTLAKFGSRWPSLAQFRLYLLADILYSDVQLDTVAELYHRLAMREQKKHENDRRKAFFMYRSFFERVVPNMFDRPAPSDVEGWREFVEVFLRDQGWEAPQEAD